MIVGIRVTALRQFPTYAGRLTAAGLPPQSLMGDGFWIAADGWIYCFK